MRIIVGDDDEDFYAMSINLRHSDYESEFSVIDDMLSRGRIEVCNGTGYEAVCADGWDYNDASVVCRELGFSSYGMLTVWVLLSTYACTQLLIIVLY